MMRYCSPKSSIHAAPPAPSAALQNPQWGQSSPTPCFTLQPPMSSAAWPDRPNILQRRRTVTTSELQARRPPARLDQSPAPPTKKKKLKKKKKMKGGRLCCERRGYWPATPNASRRVCRCVLAMRGSGRCHGITRCFSPRRRLVPGCGRDQCQSPQLVLISLDHAASRRALH